MKKLVSLCLLIALVCSLCASGVSAAALSPEELYEKYAPILDALEAEQYFAALEEIDAAATPDLDYEPVEITKDNFYDYFEIKMSDPGTYTYDDGTKCIYPGSLIVTVKDSVSKRLKWDGCSVTLSLTAKKDLYRAKVNFDKVKVTLGDKMDSKTKKELRKSADWLEPRVDTQVELFEEYRGHTYLNSTLDSDVFWYKNTKYDYWGNSPAEQGSKDKYYQVVYKNIEIVNVTGTIYVAPEA